MILLEFYEFLRPKIRRSCRCRLITIHEAAQEFERVWTAKGPIEHGFATDYRRLADRLVTALVRSGAAARFLRSEPIAIDLAGGRVVVEPNEMAELPNGTMVLRRIRTGYRREKEYDELVDQL